VGVGKYRLVDVIACPQSLHNNDISQKLFLQSTNASEIDLEAAVQHLKIPKRRIYDVVNILEGAGVLERNMHDKNTLRWSAPLISSTEQLEESLENEEQELDAWMNVLKNINTKGSISGRQLAPLLEEDTTLLAVHVPKDSIIRTIHMPQEDEEAFAFKLTVPAPRTSRMGLPKAYLLETDDKKLRPIDLAPPSPEPTFVPPCYPEGYARPRAEYQIPNPLEMLLQALPKLPPIPGTFSLEANELPGLEALEVCSDDDEERTLSPFETLLQASALCQ